MIRHRYGADTINKDTPITLAIVTYDDRAHAVADFKGVMASKSGGAFDHVAVAVITKDPDGKVEVERRAAGLAGAGGIAGHLAHDVPKETVREMTDTLDAGDSGLIVVAVIRRAAISRRCSVARRRSSSMQRPKAISRRRTTTR